MQKRGSADFAAHWISSMLETLCWKVDVYELDYMCSDPEHDTRLPPLTKSTVRHPTSHSTLSWAWASIDGSIAFPSSGGQRKGVWRRLLTGRGYGMLATPFGRVKSGW